MAKDEKSIRFDDFVAKARPKPDEAQTLVLLKGYIGKSSENAHIRVYSDESLNDFIEVPLEDIVHTESVGKEESSLGGSYLWLRQNAVYTYGNPKAEMRPKASFLEGDLINAYRARAGGGFESPFDFPGDIAIPCSNFVTNICRNWITNDCHFLISRCGNINTGNCLNLRSITCGAVWSLQTGCWQYRSLDCNHIRTITCKQFRSCGFTASILTETCANRISEWNPCAGSRTIDNPCGLNYSTLPPSEICQPPGFDPGTVFRNRGGGYGAYNPYG